MKGPVDAATELHQVDGIDFRKLDKCRRADLREYGTAVMISCNMLKNKAQLLAEYQAKAADLQTQIDRERARALAHLHEDYGFDTVDELIKAIRVVAGGRRGGRRGRPAKKAGRHRKHARITPEMREQIKTALKAGKTGGEVAANFGVSLPSVYLIKKASGLVRARKAARVGKRSRARKSARVGKAPEKAGGEK